jgi:iron complex outermembrane recepter protein
VRKYPVIIGCVVSSIGLAPPVFSAEQASIILEEIIVTAQKREENMQDVAVAMTVLTAETIEEGLISSAAELPNLVASLNLSGSGETRDSSFFIRGIGTQSFSSGVEASVSTMVDGVVMGRSGMAFSKLADIKAVEVLKGPQGTLFGKNSSGGVIHIITKDPTPEFEASVAARVIERGEQQLNAIVSGPITDSLGYRISGYQYHRDGHYTNLFDGDDVNGSDDWGVRAKLLWEPSDDVTIKFSVDSSELDADCCVFGVRSTASDDSPYATKNNSAKVEKFTTEVNFDGEFSNKQEANGYALQADWMIGDFALTSITAFRDWSSEIVQDPDVSPEPKISQSGATEQDQLSQELRLASPSDSELEYVVGLYYFQQNLERTFNRQLAHPFLELDSTTNLTADTVNYAAFAQFTYHFSSNWSAILGTRYTDEELDTSLARTGLTLAGGIPIGPAAPFEVGSSDSDTSYKLGLQWDATEDIMTYAHWSEGYKGRAIDVVFDASDAIQPLNPETSDAYEIGLKSMLFDRRLQFNLAAFYATYEDYQTQAQDPDTQRFELINAGQISTRGIEMDLLARPIPDLIISAGLAVIDGRIDDLKNGSCGTGQQVRGECDGGTQDLSGGELPYTPDWKLTLSSKYIQQLSSVPFNLVWSASYVHQDDVLKALDQDQFKVQDSYGLLDLALTAVDRQGRYSATLFVKNALDEAYAAAIFDNFFEPGGYADVVDNYYQRAAGIELKYNWF